MLTAIGQMIYFAIARNDVVSLRTQTQKDKPSGESLSFYDPYGIRMPRGYFLAMLGRPRAHEV